MLILRGLVLTTGGFLFILLPGLIISFLTRRSLRFDTNLLLWGMGVMVVTLFPAMFLTSILRVLLLGNKVAGLATLLQFALLGGLIEAFFLEGGIYLLMRWRHTPPENLPGTGILLGFGVGLLINVFQGFSLVGAGIRLAFGDISMPDLARVASQPWVDLLASLTAMNVYRIALVAVSAVLGALVARALLTTRKGWFWLAVAFNTSLAWIYTAIGLMLGTDSLTANLAVIVFEAIVAGFAIWWLIRQVPAARQPAAQKTTTVLKKR